jgi:phosphatidate phosphatase APP1
MLLAVIASCDSPSPAGPSGRSAMIVFFPTYARRIDQMGGWRVTVSGMVSRPLPPASRRRSVAVAVLKRLLRLDEAQLSSEIFQDRAEAFLFQRIAGQAVRIRLGERVLSVGVSDRAGHFEHSFDLDETTVAAAATATPGGWRLPFSLVTDRHEPTIAEPVSGQVQLVDREGVSVISDIDDTIKVTNVADRRELLANTLLREFTAVPDMVAAYRDWSLRGIAFHYVSASPWQLAVSLRQFFDTVGLPDGSMHLRLFRLKDSTPLGRIPSSKRSKRAAIIRICDHFPQRRFILVGDSGERDPDVYAAVVRQRPAQIAGVAIRRVASSTPWPKVEQRLQQLAGLLPAGGVRVFTAAEELADLIPRQPAPPAGYQGLSKAF